MCQLSPYRLKMVFFLHSWQFVNSGARQWRIKASRSVYRCRYGSVHQQCCALVSRPFSVGVPVCCCLEVCFIASIAEEAARAVYPSAVVEMIRQVRRQLCDDVRVSLQQQQSRVLYLFTYDNAQHTLHLRMMLVSVLPTHMLCCPTQQCILCIHGMCQSIIVCCMSYLPKFTWQFWQCLVSVVSDGLLPGVICCSGA